MPFQTSRSKETSQQDSVLRRNGAAVTTIAHRAHPLGFKEQIIPLWDLECLVDDAATFYTDCGSDRPCARTRSAHVPAKPSGPVRPLSKWAGAWESGHTQLLGAGGTPPSGRPALRPYFLL